MTHDPKTQALMADVDAIRQRIVSQRKKDPDHLVALAMFNADLRRAQFALKDHLAICLERLAA